VSDNIKILQFA